VLVVVNFVFVEGIGYGLELWVTRFAFLGQIVVDKGESADPFFF
jgi:hypothetical protein